MIKERSLNKCKTGACIYLFTNLHLSKVWMENKRLMRVPWCETLIFIPGMSPKDTYGELGFQIYTKIWLDENSHDFWHHSAGENRGAGIHGMRAGIWAKRSGQSRGWPDWVCPAKKLAIELKLPKGVVSDDQMRWLVHFKQIGWHSETIRSFERFKELVEGC